MSRYLNALCILLLTIIIAACSNSRDLASQNTNNSFKDGVNRMSYHYPGPSSALYGKIYRSLLKHGFHISQENEEKGVLHTSGKSIGQNTKIKLKINIEQITEDSAIAHFRSEWAADQDDPVIVKLMSGKDYEIYYEPAIWGDNEQPDLAYSYMYRFVRQLDTHKNYTIRHHTD